MQLRLYEQLCGNDSGSGKSTSVATLRQKCALMFGAGGAHGVKALAPQRQIILPLAWIAVRRALSYERPYQPNSELQEKDNKCAVEKGAWFNTGGS